MSGDDTWEVYAIQCAHRPDRHRYETFITNAWTDPLHDTLQPISYYVWAIVNRERAFVVDTGFEVELRWAPAGDAIFIDLPPERSATGAHEMYSLFFDVWEASVSLDGRRLPGMVTKRKLHGRRAPTSFLALSETWVNRHGAG